MDKKTEKLSDVDKMALELVKTKRQVTIAQAEKALAQNEAAELSYKYVVLQIFMKYGMNAATDSITEDGEIIRVELEKSEANGS